MKKILCAISLLLIGSTLCALSSRELRTKRDSLFGSDSSHYIEYYHPDCRQHHILPKAECSVAPGPFTVCRLYPYVVIPDTGRAEFRLYATYHNTCGHFIFFRRVKLRTDDRVWLTLDTDSPFKIQRGDLSGNFHESYTFSLSHELHQLKQILCADTIHAKLEGRHSASFDLTHEQIATLRNMLSQFFPEIKVSQPQQPTKAPIPAADILYRKKD